MLSFGVCHDDVIIMPIVCQSYPSQTKILEGLTNRPESVFEALFNASWLSGKVGSTFQNLRLGSIKVTR
jgi:hypothetical protein